MKKDEVVFTTKWFDVIARHTDGVADAHYLINCTDFVVVIALNPQGHLLLVRQFRPAISDISLEFPSGHVEPGESPEAAARRELLEETGHVAEDIELVTTLSPAIGRFTNRMWCYFVSVAHPVADPDFKLETGVELVVFRKPLRSILEADGFLSSLSCASLLAAVLKRKLDLGD